VARSVIVNLVELGPADDGRQIAVGLADTVVLRLPESGAAGYGWDIALDGPGRVADDRIEQPAGPIAGAALIRRLALALGAAGRVVVRAARHSPWDRTVEQYRVELDVG
jgi:hypothetical protein